MTFILQDLKAYCLFLFPLKSFRFHIGAGLEMKKKYINTYIHTYIYIYIWGVIAARSAEAGAHPFHPQMQLGQATPNWPPPPKTLQENHPAQITSYECDL